MMVLTVDLIWILLLIWKIMAESDKPFNLNFQQHDYNLDFEWAEVVRYNKQKVAFFNGNAFKYNRTCTAANLTFQYNFDIGSDLELVVQAYKFASNEYRLFPIRLQVNFCEGLSKNLVGASRAFNCGNFSGCPLVKNKRQVICNWAPDSSQFPPYIPSGKYKLEVQGTYRSEELWALNAYGKVYRRFDKK